MRNKMFGMICASLLLLLYGCGGGGGGASPAAPTVSGVAAAGAPIAGTVTLTDSTGRQAVPQTTGTDGSFSFNVAGLSKPYLLSVGSGASVLYSIAVDQGTANINPMANLVVAFAGAAAGKTPGASASDIAAIAGNLGPALLDVQTTLKPFLDKYNAASVDPIKGAYTASVGAKVGSVLDQMFDSVTISINSGSVTVTDSGSAPLAPVAASLSVGGKVTLSGVGLAGVTVTVTNASSGAVFGSASTAADGSYAILGIPNGNWTFTATNGFYSFPTGTTVAVSSTNSVGPNFQTFQPLTLSGTVASSNGGLQGVTVSAQGAEGTNALTGVTDGNGNYSINSLLKDVTYTITATHPDVYDKSANVATHVSFAPTTVKISGTGQLNYANNVNFSAPVPTFTLKGSVVDASQVLMPNVTLTLSIPASLPSGGTVVATAVTGADGAYSFGGIPTGCYTLGAVFGKYGFTFVSTPAFPLGADNTIFSVTESMILNATGQLGSGTVGGSF